MKHFLKAQISSYSRRNFMFRGIICLALLSFRSFASGLKEISINQKDNLSSQEKILQLLDATHHTRMIKMRISKILSEAPKNSAKPSNPAKIFSTEVEKELLFQSQRYQKSFTEDEVDELIKFFSSPLGAKLISLDVDQRFDTVKKGPFNSYFEKMKIRR